MSLGALLGVLASLALVLGLLGVALRLLRRWAPALGGERRLPLELLDRLSVGPRQGLALVRVGRRVLVVSVGDGGVRPVTELAPDEAALAMSPADETRPRGGAGLLRSLRALALGALLLPLAWAEPAAAQQPAPETPTPAAAAGHAAADSLLAEAARSMELRLGGDGAEGSGLRLSGTVGSVVLIGALTLIPTMLLMMTSFTRILIVLHFLRQAIGTPTSPPGHLVSALALVLTGFVMAPTLSEANRTALVPWQEGRIGEGEMLRAAVLPFRDFMARQTSEADLARFLELSAAPAPERVEEVSLTVLTSAFAVGELRRAFQMGFAIFLPFIVIDLAVAAVLTSMGMFMLPPTMIALPCKLLLFVLVDGWTLVVQSLVASFA